jgi:hypothetical protein
MKFVFPHLEDKNLDRWVMKTKPTGVSTPTLKSNVTLSSSSSVGGTSRAGRQDLDLAEALQRFHIASCKTIPNR